MLSNAYGQFESDGSVFAITDPATPMPWVNVISNGRYGLVVSQNGGGFSWLDNSQLNVLTRWEMDLARDVWGKHLYVSDLEAEGGREVWSLAPSPCLARYEWYRCEHTQGRTTFRTRKNGIDAEWTLCVPPGDPAEVWLVRLTNTTKRARRLRISSYLEWCCGVAPDTKREFHRLFITTRQDAARGAIIATKNMWDVPAREEKEHWNRAWPYVAAHAVGGMRFEQPLSIADKREFLGRAGRLEAPAAMTRGAAGTDGFGRFGDACAALGGDFVLKAGESTALSYMLCVTQSEGELRALIDRYREPAAAEEAIESSREFWSGMLRTAGSRTASADFDTMNNHWLPYQAISGRLWGRTGYYQQSGALGFRDQLQDSQVWLPRDPAKTKQQIELHAAHQFTDGSVYHWWHPLTETGLRTQCSDDYLWLAFVTINYIKETGDVSILEMEAPFVDGPAGTLLDHCERAMNRSRQRQSARGLPLIGSCDWNDGLSALGVEGKGESVWLGMFLSGLLEDMGALYERLGLEERAADCAAWRETLCRSIDEHAWDGAWYRCATRDDGRWIGAKDNAQGRMYLNPQTWAVLSGGLDAERTARAWQSVKDVLLKEMGPLLLHPAYSEPDEDIGYITRYAPGLRENGGVYMHAATWALAAACKRREVLTAERIWRAISPPVRSGDAESYRAEPYVTPGNVDGPDSETPGKAGWTWYTGSAAWLNRVCLEWVLGVRPTWEGLLIDPCPWAGLGKVTTQRMWRGTKVIVRFDAREHVAGVPVRLSMGDREIPGNVLRPGDVQGKDAVEIDAGWSAWVRGSGRVSVPHSTGLSSGSGPVLPAEGAAEESRATRRSMP
ncbi:MAG: glycosyl transferase family 36 [Phycisphaerales bacterium]